MNREERRCDSAARQRARQAPEDQEDEPRVGRVPEHALQVKTPRITRPEELSIKKQRQHPSGCQLMK